MKNNNDEIDLVELLKTAWDGRKQIIIISSIFILIGVVVALRSPVIYTSSTTFINISGHLKDITAIVGPPTYPAPIQQMFFIDIPIKKNFDKFY